MKKLVLGLGVVLLTAQPVLAQQEKSDSEENGKGWLLLLLHDGDENDGGEGQSGLSMMNKKQAGTKDGCSMEEGSASKTSGKEESK